MQQKGCCQLHNRLRLNKCAHLPNDLRCQLEVNLLRLAVRTGLHIRQHGRRQAHPLPHPRRRAAAAGGGCQRIAQLRLPRAPKLSFRKDAGYHQRLVHAFQVFVCSEQRRGLCRRGQQQFVPAAAAARAAAFGCRRPCYRCCACCGWPGLLEQIHCIVPIGQRLKAKHQGPGSSVKLHKGLAGGLLDLCSQGMEREQLERR